MVYMLSGWLHSTVLLQTGTRTRIGRKISAYERSWTAAEVRHRDAVIREA